jgi:hypothetical protein
VWIVRASTIQVVGELLPIVDWSLDIAQALEDIEDTEDIADIEWVAAVVQFVGIRTLTVEDILREPVGFEGIEVDTVEAGSKVVVEQDDFAEVGVERDVEVVDGHVVAAVHLLVLLFQHDALRPRKGPP